MAENKYTATDLKQMQQWPLEQKIQVAQTRILEFALHYDNQVFIAFSGGKDSTVLLDLVRRVIPDAPAVFIDTGLEYPEVKEFVRSCENVEIRRPKRTFREVIERFGYPVVSKKVAGYVSTAKRNPNSTRAKYLSGELDSKIFGFGEGKWWYLVDAPFKISDHCCDAMKKQPNRQYTRETGRHPILGTLASESIARRNEWMRTGCNLFDSTEPMCKPLSIWTDNDILEYIVRFNIPYCPLYGEIIKDKKGNWLTTGIHRTGCIFCAFGVQNDKCPNRFQQLKETHPKIWEYCMRPWDSGGLGMKEVLDYIHIPSE